MNKEFLDETIKARRLDAQAREADARSFIAIGDIERARLYVRLAADMEKVAQQYEEMVSPSEESEGSK